MRWINLAACAALGQLGTGAVAADPRPAPGSSEIAVGILDHAIRKPFRADPPSDFDLYEGEEEAGTADIQLVVRSAPLKIALEPRITGRLQVSTAGRTNFAAIGAEWRQHILRGRAYGQIGIGLALHDGYRFTPDPFVPGLERTEFRRRVEIYETRTGFGSQVLFNPNLSFGVRLSDRWAIEATFEHFSHRRLFSDQNPGLNSAGLRLVRAIGGQ